MESFYIHKEGQNFGPFSPAQIEKSLKARHFTGVDLAYDGANWLQLKDIPELGKLVGENMPTNSSIKGVKTSKPRFPKKLIWIMGGGSLILVILISIILYWQGGKQNKNYAALSNSEVLLIKPIQIVEVYDGDTFKIDLEGIHPIFGDDIPIRVRGIDTPEIRGSSEQIKAMAVEARELTKRILTNGHRIELRNPERGKYFRIVAEVWVDGKTLADQLKAKGLAKDYDGEGKRPEW